MYEIKQQDYFQAVRQEDTTWPAYELRWPCYNYVIAEQPTGHLAVLWEKRTQSLVQDMERDQRGKMHGIARVTSAPWPEGGVFVPEKFLMLNRKTQSVRFKEPVPHQWYNPAAKGKEIWLDIQRCSPEDPKALLKFVNKWGRLGIGIPEEELFPFDAVIATGQYLKTISRWIQTYEALQKGRTKESSFKTLAFYLNEFLTGIRPGVQPTKKGLDPIYQVSRLSDVLWLECWEMATTGKQLLRCPECRAYFLPGRANQMYCNRRCAIRPTVRKAKAKKRKKEKTKL